MEDDPELPDTEGIGSEAQSPSAPQSLDDRYCFPDFASAHSYLDLLNCKPNLIDPGLMLGGPRSDDVEGPGSSDPSTDSATSAKQTATLGDSLARKLRSGVEAVHWSELLQAIAEKAAEAAESKALEEAAIHILGMSERVVSGASGILDLLDALKVSGTSEAPWEYEDTLKSSEREEYRREIRREIDKAIHEVLHLPPPSSNEPMLNPP